MVTESTDPRYIDIDGWPTETAVQAMLEGQMAAVASLASQVGAIAVAADRAADRLRAGGRIVYVGAGTSGRVAVQDGVELVPTYNWPKARLAYLLAGGMAALAASVEGAEDDRAAAVAAVEAGDIGAEDVVVGVAASGRTPYTIAAIEAARLRGALTIAIANNPDAPLLAAAELAILADTGAELVAGSTRMKAGTAQKAVLNMLSTAIMLRCGRVYRGMMVNMRVSNAKLAIRARRMVADLAGVDDERAAAALRSADDDIKLAVLLAQGAGLRDARDRLAAADGELRLALESSAGKAIG